MTDLETTGQESEYWTSQGFKFNVMVLPVLRIGKAGKAILKGWGKKAHLSSEIDIKVLTTLGGVWVRYVPTPSLV